MILLKIPIRVIEIFNDVVAMDSLWPESGEDVYDGEGQQEQLTEDPHPVFYHLKPGHD